MATEKLRAHEMLSGMTVGRGWKVLEMIKRGDSASGGHFSCGYFAENSDGRRGYLKALDFFSGLEDSDDPARDLQPLLEAYNFERDLLLDCRERRLSRVVTALDDGAVTVPNIQGPAKVQYIIFELAQGDIRSQMTDADILDTAWKLRSLHHIAVGLNQLHQIGVAHQDLKPSNVLMFEERRASKVADLGRAAARGKKPPHYDLSVPGDLGYAPPELLYDTPASSWEGRRQACDIYHLGSMVAWLFTGVAMTPHLVLRLEPDLRPNLPTRLESDPAPWTGTYAEVLPYVRAAFTDAVEYIAEDIPEACRTELTATIRELCDPDPDLRGHPRNRISPVTRYSIVRYIAHFNLLAERAEFHLTRSR